MCGENTLFTVVYGNPKDHPRVCGENCLVVALFQFSKGSPPRVRGKPGQSWKVSELKRITPACAGKTPTLEKIKCPPRDHPRVCGENLIVTAAVAASSGSPPRVRGKPLSEWERLTRLRITPACAGKTEFHGIAFARNRDHPRVCGENSNSNFNSVKQKGSPPRVRGKR